MNIALPTPPAARRPRKTGKELGEARAPVVTATMSSPDGEHDPFAEALDERAPAKAETNRKNAKALTARPTAAGPTPNARANSGMAGATIRSRARPQGDDGEDVHSRGSSPRPRSRTTWHLAVRMEVSPAPVGLTLAWLTSVSFSRICRSAGAGLARALAGRVVVTS